MRASTPAREEFLAVLVARSYTRITRAALKMVHRMQVVDRIFEDATQVFLIGANEAIDSFKAEVNDDLSGYASWKGICAVRTWINRNVIYNRNPAKRYFVDGILSLDKFAGQDAEPMDYERYIVSHMTVQDAIARLSDSDRAIVELLVYGHAGETWARCAATYGGRKHHVAADIALTIGKSEQYVYKRLAAIRETLREVV